VQDALARNAQNRYKQGKSGKASLLLAHRKRGFGKRAGEKCAGRKAKVVNRHADRVSHDKPQQTERPYYQYIDKEANPRRGESRNTIARPRPRTLKGANRRRRNCLPKIMTDRRGT